MLSSDKHFSLFCSTFTDEEKKLHNTDCLCQCCKTFFITDAKQNKLECFSVESSLIFAKKVWPNRHGAPCSAPPCIYIKTISKTLKNTNTLAYFCSTATDGWSKAFLWRWIQETAVQLTSDIVFLEFIHRIVVCLFEALCTFKGTRGLNFISENNFL